MVSVARVVPWMMRETRGRREGRQAAITLIQGSAVDHIPVLT